VFAPEYAEIEFRVEFVRGRTSIFEYEIGISRFPSGNSFVYRSFPFEFLLEYSRQEIPTVRSVPHSYGYRVHAWVDSVNQGFYPFDTHVRFDYLVAIYRENPIVRSERLGVVPCFGEIVAPFKEFHPVGVLLRYFHGVIGRSGIDYDYFVGSLYGLETRFEHCRFILHYDASGYFRHCHDLLKNTSQCPNCPLAVAQSGYWEVILQAV
jgi:hypothetical protein